MGFPRSERMSKLFLGPEHNICHSDTTTFHRLDHIACALDFGREDYETMVDELWSKVGSGPTEAQYQERQGLQSRWPQVPDSDGKRF